MAVVIDFDVDVHVDGDKRFGVQVGVRRTQSILFQGRAFAGLD